MINILADGALEGARKRGERWLRGADIRNARNESDWMLRKALDSFPSDRAAALRLYERMIVDRRRRKPLAYILGTQPFMDIELAVNDSVLIPRPETELLVAEIARKYRNSTSDILEIGTGSGCIAIALARECSGARLTAADVSAAALQTARKNAMVSGVENRIQFVESHLYKSLKNRRGRSRILYDAIVSNPPYIKALLLKTLDPEVRCEPRLALDGGDDGLAVIRPLVLGAPIYLKEGGVLALEIGYDQSETVSSLMRKAGFGNIRCVKDFQNIDRVVMGDKIHG